MCDVDLNYLKDISHLGSHSCRCYDLCWPGRGWPHNDPSCTQNTDGSPGMKLGKHTLFYESNYKVMQINVKGPLP